MKKKYDNLFWISYSDLMTSLFFVMLVLYVITFHILNKEKGKYKAKAEELEKIQEIEKSLQEISDDTYFKFNSKNKRHELLIDVQFNQWSHIIDKEKYGSELINAGDRLKEIVENIDTDKDIKYLLIIEGMASRGKVDIENWERDEEKKYSVNDDITTRLYYSYILSYRRALELKKLWENNNINFNTDIFEVIVAGSGLYGTDRHTGADEPKNKRFLIQIIPKIGKINKMEKVINN